MNLISGHDKSRLLRARLSKIRARISELDTQIYRAQREGRHSTARIIQARKAYLRDQLHHELELSIPAR